MKHFLLSALALCLALNMSANKKVDTMDDNKLGWNEYSDKFGSIIFEDGHMVLKSKKLPKFKLFDVAETQKAILESEVKTFAKLPLRGKDNYKLTIKYIDPNFGNNFYNIYFNASQNCLEGDGCNAYIFSVGMKQYTLPSFDGYPHMDKLPIKGKKRTEMKLEITKKKNEATIELNGIELYSGVCVLTEPIIGFGVMMKQSIEIDEIIIEQADITNDD